MHGSPAMVKRLMFNLILLQEKEAALNWSIDSFCRLVKQQANVAQLVTM